MSLRNISRFFSSHPLTRDAQIAAWLRFASWQLRSRFSDELIVPWIEGVRLAVRRGMVGATGNLYAGLHEFEDMMVPLHFLREGDLFLDVGANVGSFSLLASGVCKAKSWAFEPDPDTIRNLKRNIAVNDLQAMVTVHTVALGERDGEVEFTVGRDSTNRVAKAGESARNVRIARLDTIVGTARPVMIKMDVEGYEEHVVSGASHTLMAPDLKIIELETTSPVVEKTLNDLGFLQASYNPFERSLARGPTSPSTHNSLYVRDWNFVQKRLLLARPICVLGRNI